MTYPTITGTVSHGTLRNADLIPAFVTALHAIDPKNLGLRYFLPRIEATQNAGAWESEQGDALLEDLIEAINTALPVGWHFGAHEGDGSDFGIWESDSE